MQIKKWSKFAIAFSVSIFVRLLPFRPPNVEPILAIQMPLAKAYGKSLAFFFAFFGIILFDLITMKIGVWTLITGAIYGMIGIFAHSFFKDRQASALNFGLFAVVSTILFDFSTGLSIGPIFFGQSFSSAFFGQIPFTLWHLLGNVSFGVVLGPVIYKILARNRSPESSFLSRFFYQNKILKI